MDVTPKGQPPSLDPSAGSGGLPQDKNDKPGRDPDGSQEEARSQPGSQDDRLKSIQDGKISQIINEVFRSREIASIYIDARNGGAYFSGETRIEGDVAGGDHVHETRFTGSASGAVYTGTEDAGSMRRQQGERNVFAGRVLAKTLQKIATVYSPPNAYERAQQILQERNLLILWGQAHWGKWTSALHLLASLHENTIFELDPTVAFEQLRTTVLAEECGYVLDTIAPENAEQLTASMLNFLSKRLQAQQSRLIITIDQRITLSSASLGTYLVSWDDVPNPQELLRKHLLWYIEDKTVLANAQALCEEENIRQLLNIHLRPSEIDRLAELIAQAVLTDLPLSEVLVRFEQRTRTLVAEWFETHSDLADRTLMIAVAAFNGATEQTVTEAQTQLQALIPQQKEEMLTVRDSFFGHTRSQRVQSVMAHIVDGHELTEFGQSPVKQIVLDNPTLQPAVLRYIWEEYDRFRPILLAWLRELGLHPSFEVRARAASAVGELSKFDFSYVRQEVLLPWANHGQSRVRQAAALALGVPAWEGTLAPQVLGLLHHWATLRNNPNLCWTAAVAYGGLVGLRFPDIALRELQQIAKQGNDTLFAAAGRSIITIFLAGTLAVDYFFQVLVMLTAWVSDSNETGGTFTGLLVFLMLSQQTKLKVGEAGESWPAMLWLTQDQASLEKITNFWRQALNTKGTRIAALEILRHWCVLADVHHYLSDALSKQITVLATQGTVRERERLFAYLARWRIHPKQASSTAGQILEHLQEQYYG